MNDNTPSIKQTDAQDSFCYILWQQQLQVMKQKNTHSRRWHPAVIYKILSPIFHTIQYMYIVYILLYCVYISSTLYIHDMYKYTYNITIYNVNQAVTRLSQHCHNSKLYDNVVTTV